MKYTGFTTKCKKCGEDITSIRLGKDQEGRPMIWLVCDCVKSQKLISELKRMSDRLRQVDNAIIDWTRNPPTKEGWYWICPQIGDQVEPVHVTKTCDGYFYFIDHEGNNCFIEDVSWWSSESIQIPKSPNGHEEAARDAEKDRMFPDDESVRQFHEHMEASTREAFESFDTARRKSNALAKNRTIG